MGPRARPNGQSAVEYLLLLSTMLVISEIVGMTIYRFGRGLVERSMTQAMTAVVQLASP
ncbi:MAG: hypothetical protein HY924_13185 [Elusimicrobia bacterium]|nr:hypothetical protein [Elusimicrobiota bacterium]